MSVFSDLKQKALGYYQSKSDSEQKLLMLLAVFLVVFIVVGTVKSVRDANLEANKKLHQQLDLNVWAAQQIDLINASKQTGNRATSTGSMAQIVNSTARRHRVTLARIQPQATNAVKLGLDEVNFNSLMSWLADLRNQHGIIVASIDISKADDAGLVKVRRLDLERN